MAIDAGFHDSIGSADFADVSIKVHSVIGPLVDAPEPPEGSMTWGLEPVERLSDIREEIVLNGLWRFVPAAHAAQTTPPTADWGYLRVPGSWRHQGSDVRAEQLIAGSGGREWSRDIRDVDRGW